MTQEDKLVIEGRRVKLLTHERAVKAHSGVIVDYFRCTVTRHALLEGNIQRKSGEFLSSDDTDAQIASSVAARWADLLGYHFGEQRPGRDFYDHTFTITDQDGHEVGSVSGGGEGQRATFCLTLKGHGCNHARKGWEEVAYRFLSPLGATITRIDLARDFFNGEKGYTDAENAYLNGEFSYRGRAPSIYQHGDFHNHHSRTFQVGKRESGKLFRGYDKGHQFRLMDDPWWRAEVELRNHNRVIPLESLIRPAGFFAGAYAFCAQLVDDALPVSIPTGQRVVEASVERTLQWFEKTVAPSLVTLCLSAGFDWLTRLAVEEAHRPRPRTLKGFSDTALKAGIEKVLLKFQHTSSAPAGSMAF